MFWAVKHFFPDSCSYRLQIFKKKTCPLAPIAHLPLIMENGNYTR